MSPLKGKIITVEKVSTKEVYADGWYWKFDSFVLIKETTSIEESSENHYTFPKNTVWQYIGTSTAAYTMGSYYLQREDSKYPTSVIDNLDNKTNGHGVNYWSKYAKIVPSAKVINFHPKKYYMCIDSSVNTANVIKGKAYKGEYLIPKKFPIKYFVEIQTETAVSIFLKNSIWQFIGKSTPAYINNHYYLQKEDSKYPASVIDELNSETNGYTTDYGLTAVKAVPSIEVTSFHPNKYYMCINIIIGTTYVVKGKVYKGKYLISNSCFPTNFLEIRIENVEEEEENSGTFCPFSENTVWQYVGESIPSYTKGGYYLQRDNNIYPHSVIDNLGSETNGCSSDVWLSHIKIIPSTKVTTFDRNKYYMCIKTAENKDHIVRGKVYNGGHILFNELPTENFLEIQTDRTDEETEAIEKEEEEEEIKSSTNTIKEEIKLMFPYPVLLEGPVGSGKSTIFIELAEELNLDYYASVMSDATTASEFKGYRNVVNGEYVGTEFRKAVEFGGIFVLEELNATTSNMPIIFNSIENGYFVFADQLVAVHPDFRLCATMNTITNAKDFGGRRPLDKSVKDRFHTIIVQADLNTRFPEEVIQLQTEINYYLKGEGSTVEVGPRDMTRYSHLVAKGMSKTEACIKTMHVHEGQMRQKVEALIRKQLKEG
jgi:predicted ABC-type ATPase